MSWLFSLKTAIVHCLDAIQAVRAETAAQAGGAFLILSLSDYAAVFLFIWRFVWGGV